jgi:hypothetical protein
MILRILPSIGVSRHFGNAGKNLQVVTKRSIAATNPVWLKKMPDRPPPVSEDEFTESFLKGSGPGGQKIVSWSY